MSAHMASIKILNRLNHTLMKLMLKIYITSSSSCARSLADIGDHGLPIPLSSVLLISSLLGDYFLVTKLLSIFVYFVRFLPLLLVPQISPLKICFSSPSALFICPKNCSCLFLMVLSRDLMYPAISIISSFDFFSVYDILIILLMYHISAASSLLSKSFVNIQHSHSYRRMNHV